MLAPAHPPNVNDYLLDALAAHGIDTLFWIAAASNSPLAELWQSAMPAGHTALRSVNASQDAGAAFMADGYARVSGRFGVCVTGAGSGATSAAAGAFVARTDGSPLLLLVGEGSDADTRGGPLRDALVAEEDALSALRAVSDCCARIDHAERVGPVLNEAFNVVEGVHPRIAVVGVRGDITAEQAPPTISSPGSGPEPCVDTTRWGEHFDALLTSKRPLLLLGSGARRALSNPCDPAAAERLERLREAISRHAVPVVTSPRAKGVFPESHPMSLGCQGLGGNEWCRRYVHRGISALVVVGSRLGPWTTGGRDRRLAPQGPLVHVDLDARVPGRSYAKSTSVRADAARFLDAFIDHACEVRPSASAERRRRSFSGSFKYGARWRDDEQRSSLETPLKPQRVMSELGAVLNHHARCRGGVNLFCDIGDVLGWAWEHLVIDPPHRFWCSPRVGPLGWACCAALGGKLADNEQPCLALVGAHALLAHGAEISTAVRYRVGTVWLVLCDADRDEPKSSSQVPSVRRGWRHTHSVTALDTARRAEALGATVREVKQPGALVRELDQALSRAQEEALPQVLVVHIDGNEVPAFPHLLTRDWAQT